MSTPVLTPPATARRAPPVARGPASAPPPRSPRDPSQFDRILRWSLLVSLAVHALLLLVAGPFLQLKPTPELLRRPAPRADRLADMQWVVPVPEGAEGDGAAGGASSSSTAAPTAAGAAPSLERPRVVRVRPGADTPMPGASEPPSAAGATGAGSVREALRPGYRDPRLYVDPRQVPLPEKSDRQKYMDHLHARIDAVNDSLYGEAEAARRATDWTFKDKEGRRWGLSPDGLHLGGVTVPRELVPLPRATGDNQQLEGEREKQRQREEIRRQEEDRKRRRAGEESTGETRRRKDAERKRDGGGDG